MEPSLQENASRAIRVGLMLAERSLDLLLPSPNPAPSHLPVTVGPMPEGIVEMFVAAVASDLLLLLNSSSQATLLARDTPPSSNLSSRQID